MDLFIKIFFGILAIFLTMLLILIVVAIYYSRKRITQPYMIIQDTGNSDSSEERKVASKDILRVNRNINTDIPIVPTRTGPDYTFNFLGKIDDENVINRNLNDLFIYMDRPKNNNFINPEAYRIKKNYRSMYTLEVLISNFTEDWNTKKDIIIKNIRDNEDKIKDSYFYKIDKLDLNNIIEDIENKKYKYTVIANINFRIINNNIVDIYLNEIAAGFLPRGGGSTMFCFLLNYIRKLLPTHDIALTLSPINDKVEDIYSKWGFESNKLNMTSNIVKTIDFCNSNIRGHTFNYYT